MLDSERLVEAGWLVKRARVLRGLTQEALAEAAGVGQSVLSRIESNVQEPTLSDLQRLLASAGTRLGVSLYRAAEPSPFDWYECNYAYRVNDSRLGELIPQPLCSASGRLDHDSDSGPAVGEAVYWQGEVRRLALAARAPEAWLHAAYGDYHYERDRDLVHAVLHCGAGASQAHWALEAALEAARPQPRRRFARQNRAESPRIGGLAYAHAVLAVRGEAVICARVASYCRRSVEAAVDHERAQSRVTLAREDLQIARSMHAKRGDDSKFVETAATTVADAEAEETRADENRRQAIIRGGTPHPSEVGAAGERLLMSAFAQLSHQAWTLYTQMAEHPCIQPWRPDPDDPPPIRSRSNPRA